MPEQIITTCTRDCPNTCGLIATVEKGKVVRLSGNPAHELTRGFSCHKCMKFVARVYSPDRILTPLRKKNDQWQRISWEEAIDEIADRMNNILAYAGPEAILYYRGFAQRTALKLVNERFFNLLGGVSGLYGTLCGGTGQAAQNLDFGCRVSHDPLDYHNSNSIILWGRNPTATNPYLLPFISQLRQRGAPVVVVDPVASESTKICSLHIQPAPGKDVYLAFAVAKILLSKNKFDQHFLDASSVGFAAYKKILDAYSLEELSNASDVPLHQIAALAEVFITHFPTGILLGWGLHRWEYAHYAIRAIDALGAIAGILGIPGGGVSQGFEEDAPYNLAWTGDSLHPQRRKLLMPCIGQEILNAKNPEIEMIFVTAGNPVCQAPNSAKVAAAFAKVPFTVVAGLFMDDTARAADIFLPSTTFLEEQDVMASYGHNYVGPVNQVIKPVGEAKSDFELFQLLASRFGMSDFAKNGEEWLELLLAPLIAQGISLEQLRQGPIRLPGTPMVPYEDRHFPTPSGKFQFMTDFCRPLSWAPDDEYPYYFMSIAPHEWLCSETTPAEQTTLTVAKLHPLEAARLQMVDGDIMLIRSPIGQIEAILQTDVNQRRDLVVFPRGKWLESGSSANVVTKDLVSKVGNGTPYYETKVKIERFQY